MARRANPRQLILPQLSKCRVVMVLLLIGGHSCQNRQTVTHIHTCAQVKHTRTCSCMQGTQWPPQVFDLRAGYDETLTSVRERAAKQLDLQPEKLQLWRHKRVGAAKWSDPLLNEEAGKMRLPAQHVGTCPFGARRRSVAFPRMQGVHDSAQAVWYALPRAKKSFNPLQWIYAADWCIQSRASTHQTA